ncbi:MAG: hypothetical protein RMK57_07905 [Bryobacterales bacterium]|nr:hypothetical protein [Bryobacteraceae bacterium]MDW8354440.1 hypothetical protein [Bryobacterales bacterium]
MRPALLLAATALLAQAATNPRVSRAALVQVEQQLDRRIETAFPDNPFLLLSTTQGVYLEGYGAVFTAEVNLISAPAPSPFRPAFTREDVEKVRLKKLERVTALKGLLKEALVEAAASLAAVPPDEQIAIAVSLFYFRTWENTTGLPSQILIQAPRGVLVEYRARRISEQALEAALRIQEF